MENSYIPAVILSALFILIIFLIIGLKMHSGTKTRIAAEKDFITVFMEKQQLMLKKSGIKISAQAFVSVSLVIMMFIGIIAYLISGNVIFSILAAAMSLILPYLFLNILSARHAKRFEERYARSLKQLASSLNAGRSIIQAVDDVAACKYVNEQLRKEYLSMSNSLRLGIPVTKAFRNFAENVSSSDADDVALAIEVQNEIGGHEAETILEIANNIQDRILMRKEIKTIFSSTASMIRIMNVVVPVCMLVFALTNTSYIGIYFSSPILIIVFIILLGLPVLGMYLTKRTMKNIQPKD